MSTAKRVMFVIAIMTLSVIGIAQVRAADQDLNHSAIYQDTGNAWLGIRVQNDDAGVTVVDVVPGSPAETAGLQHGDVITAVNGTALTSSEDLISMVQTFQVGAEVILTVTSGDESRDVTVTLAERPAEFAQPNAPMTQNMGMLSMFGVSATLSDEGLTIDSIAEDSPLADVGLQAGDVITALDGEALSNLNPRDVMQQLRDKGEVTLTVQRGGEEIEVTLDLATLREQIGQMPMMPESGQQGGMMPGMPGQGGMMFGTVGSNGFLGVSFQPVTADLATEQNLTVQEGALIEEVVDGSPAADAGLQVGDVITAVNGEAVDEEHTLRDRLIAYEPDDVVTLTVQRGDESLDVEATLAQQPAGMMQGGMMPGQGMMPGMPGQQGGMMNPGQGGTWFWMPDQQFFQNHPFMQPGMPEPAQPTTPSNNAGPSA